MFGHHPNEPVGACGDLREAYGLGRPLTTPAQFLAEAAIILV